MDAQRNRQRGHGSMAGRERDRDRGKTGVAKFLPALMDPSLTEGTGKIPGLEKKLPSRLPLK